MKNKRTKVPPKGPKLNLENEETEIIRQIVDNYIRLEESIISQLRIAVRKHHVTSGTFREDIWKSLFEQIIPQKFSIAQSVFIIDSNGRVSKEVDLAIFDEQYTPYIFRLGRIKYIPIEAVAVVIQCKSDNVTGEKSKKILYEWFKSINRLETSLKSITRTQTRILTGEYGYKCENGVLLGDGSTMTQTSTRPIQILCHTLDRKKEYVEPFDFNIHPDPTGTRLQVHVSSKLKSLPQWNNHLNHKPIDKYANLKDTKFDLDDEKMEKLSEEFKEALQIDKYRVKKQENEISLLSLTFQLNQLLMLINNPILFPHKAYVDMFNNKLK